MTLKFVAIIITYSGTYFPATLEDFLWTNVFLLEKFCTTLITLIDYFKQISSRVSLISVSFSKCVWLLLEEAQKIMISFSIRNCVWVHWYVLSSWKYIRRITEKNEMLVNFKLCVVHMWNIEGREHSDHDIEFVPIRWQFRTKIKIKEETKKNSKKSFWTQKTYFSGLKAKRKC